MDYKKMIVKKASATISKENIPSNSLIVIHDNYDVRVFVKDNSTLKQVAVKDKHAYNIDNIIEYCDKLLAEDILKNGFAVFVGKKKEIKEDYHLEEHHTNKEVNPVDLIPDTLQDFTSYFNKYQKDESW